MATNKRVRNKKCASQVLLLEEKVKELQSIEHKYNALIERIKYENQKAEQGTSDYDHGRFSLSREILRLT